MEAPATPLSVAARFALIIGGLRAAVAARIGYYAVTGPMIVYICNRLNKINQRFQALAALIVAGKLPPERGYRRRPAAETAPVPPPPGSGAAGARDFFPIWRLVPTHRFAWLCMVAPNWAGSQYASVWGAALRSLLADPEMVALLAATPRMAKLLRPLCWGLGIEASQLRPRPAAASVSELAIDLVVPDGGGIGSNGADATARRAATLLAASDPPQAARAEGVFVPRFFAPA